MENKETSLFLFGRRRQRKEMCSFSQTLAGLFCQRRSGTPRASKRGERGEGSPNYLRSRHPPPPPPQLQLTTLAVQAAARALQSLVARNPPPHHHHFIQLVTSPVRHSPCVSPWFPGGSQNTSACSLSSDVNEEKLNTNSPFISARTSC